MKLKRLLKLRLLDKRIEEEKIMLENLKTKILRVLLKKYILGWLVKAYEKTTGYKTQICVFFIACVWIAETWGNLPHDVAENLYKYLEAIAGVSVLQKLKRYQWVNDELAKSVQGEVKK